MFAGIRKLHLADNLTRCRPRAAKKASLLAFVLYTWALAACMTTADRPTTGSLPSLQAPMGAVLEPPRRIVFQNRYYAKPGMADEVYRWRVHASDLLERFGIPRGVIYRGSGGDQPDVIWQLELEPVAAALAVKRQEQRAKEFEPVMKQMGTLVRFFEGNRYAELSHREAGTSGEACFLDENARSC